MTQVRCLSGLLISVLLATVAVAETGDWYGAAQVVYTDDDGDRKIDDSVAGGQLHLGRELSENFALEGMLGYSDIEGFPGQEHLDIGLNVLGYIAPEHTVSPYFIAGLGYLGTETTNGIEENRPSGTLGLGFRIRLGDSRIAIRGEYRARLAWEGDDNLTDRIGSLGFQFSFGDNSKAVSAIPETDGDHDGVPNLNDRCPHTEPGVTVDSVGCEHDDDADGVTNSQDVCPATPAGVAVDQNGCQLDNDRDGVVNGLDQCPDTLDGVPVDQNGCEPDGDGDGVVDRLDDCPNTTGGVPVDINGCEIRDVIRLPGVNFSSNSDVLLSGTEAALADAAATLRQNPDLIIEVAGHTDSDGAAAFNLGLSERRAETVRDYLINAGVNPANLSARGYGELEPITDNSTAQGKAENRRVELRVINR